TRAVVSMGTDAGLGGLRLCLGQTWAAYDPVEDSIIYAARGCVSVFNATDGCTASIGLSGDPNRGFGIAQGTSERFASVMVLDAMHGLVHDTDLGWFPFNPTWGIRTELEDGGPTRFRALPYW